MRTEVKKVLRVVNQYGGMEAYTAINIMKDWSFASMPLTDENLDLFKGLEGKKKPEGFIMFTVEGINIFLVPKYNSNDTEF